MSGRVSFDFAEVCVSFNAPDAMLEQLGASAGDKLEAVGLEASPAGLTFLLPKKGYITHGPYSVRGLRWAQFFKREARGAVTVAGRDAVTLYRKWEQQCRERLAKPRASGAPTRTERWNPIREELLARILERRQRGDSLPEAIEATAQVEPEHFRRAFGGRYSKKRAETAKKYLKRRQKDK